MKQMQLIVMALLMSVGFELPTFGQGNFFPLYKHANLWGGTNIWYVSLRLLTNAPRWDIGKEPPLSIGQAVKIAERQLFQNVSPQGAWIDQVMITPLDSNSGPNRGIYYYNILFGGVSYFGHYDRCIILMDGTVVKPTIFGSKLKDFRRSDFDEN